MAQIDQFLRALVENEGSDLHLTTGAPPVMRVHGTMQRIKFRELTPGDMETLLLELLDEEGRERFRERTALEVPYEVEGLARFRIHLFQQRKGMGAVVRAIPRAAPSVEDLDLPPAVVELCSLRHGLVVVTGPLGSGRSTTLAALVDRINRTRSGHVLTVEDPIEFVHESRKALVNQREVGRSARSFASALRASLREDPDVVMVGDLGERETMELALESAEGGRLVLGALSTRSARTTVERIVDLFPAERRERVRGVVADTLRGIVSLALLEGRGGGGRVAAREILLGTTAVADLIRAGRLHQIPTLVQTGRKRGMQSLDQHILELLMSDRVTAEEAHRAAHDKRAFRRFLDADSDAPSP